MALTSSDLVFRYAESMSSLGSSGGHMSFDNIVSGAMGNVFPAVPQAVRLAGNLDYPWHRKIFACNVSALQAVQSQGFSPRLQFFRPNPSASWLHWVLGTQSSRREDLSGSEVKYGTAMLDQNAVAGDLAVVIRLKDASQADCFTENRAYRISSFATPDSTSGNSEIIRPTAVSVADTQITFTLPVPGLQNNYDADPGNYNSGATVCGVYEHEGELGAAVTDINQTNGVPYDSVAHPPLLSNDATACHVITLSRVTGTQFGCVSDRFGNLGSGQTSQDFAPLNPKIGKPYFTLPAAAWTANIPEGWSMTFLTVPGALPIHEFLMVPPNCPPMVGDGIIMQLEVESGQA